jgi:hypothetical protein
MTSSSRAKKLQDATRQRRRDRVRAGKELFPLALDSDDVAAALLAMGLCGPEADLTDPEIVTPILQQFVESFLTFVTDGSTHKVVPAKAIRLRSLSEK